MPAIWLIVLSMISGAALTHAQNIDPQMRHSTRIEQVTPNPYDPSHGIATITLVLVNDADAELTIYAIDGTLVARLLTDRLTKGTHVVDWDGRGMDGSHVANGVYICRLQMGRVIRSANIVVSY